jgi:hypothetical protein
MSEFESSAEIRFETANKTFVFAYITTDIPRPMKVVFFPLFLRKEESDFNTNYGDTGAETMRSNL